MSARSVTRRTLQELQVLYALHPNLRDVVVEGRDDAAWLRWYLAEHGLSAGVYAVDDRVTVPSEMVRPVHQDVNPRGRVVALAAAAKGWSLPGPSLTCVVDADFDLFEAGESPDDLLTTDYASMEVYALAKRPLSKFLVSMAKSEIEAEELVALLKPAWAVVYSLRYVLHRHTDGARLADNFADRCFNSSREIVADVQELLRAVTPSPRREMLSEILKLHAEFLEKVPGGDSLQGIRGHDIAPMIIRFLRLRNDMAHPDNVEKIMRSALELRDLDDYDLFRRLRERVAN